MKSRLPLLLAGAVFAAASAHAQSTLLFRDDFTRPNNTNLNASTDGQSGGLSPLSWVEVNCDSGTAEINGNELRIDSAGGGGSGAIVYPDNNFSGLTSLTVTMNIASGVSGGDGRSTGFGIGYSKSALDGKTSVSTVTGQAGGSDIYIAYDTIGTTRLIITENGSSNVSITPIPSPAYPVEYSIVCTFADMNDGTTINYQVFENAGATPIYSGTTTWSGTDQNYIGFASNYTSNADIEFISIEGEIPPPPPVVKADNTDDLNLGTSWVGGIAPASGDLAQWDSTVTAANTTVLGSDQTWGSIAIVDPTGLVTISPGNTLTLDSIGTAIDLSAATADMTINSGLALSGSGSLDVATGRTLTLGGVVSGGSGLTKAGDGVAVISGNNTYTGGTNVDGGVLQLGASDVIPDTTDSGDVSVTGTLDLNGNSDTIWALNGSGTVDNTADATTSTLTVGDFGKSGTFSGTLQNSGVGATLNLEKIGAGNLVLSGANTYSGTTTVSNGSLEIENLAALGSTSEIALADGAELNPDIDGLVVTAPITLGAAATTSFIGVPIDGGTMTLNGVISGDGDLVFTDFDTFGSNTTGIVLLGAASNYTGTTTIDTNGLLGNNTVVRSGIADALPTTTVLSLEGAGGQGSGRSVTFDLDGNDQTLAGLTNVPQFDRKQFVTTSTSATLTINNADDFTFGEEAGGDSDVAIQNAISLAKSGAGTLTLVNSQTYTGSTTITEGTLQGEVGGGIASSAVTLSSLGTYAVLVSDETQSWTCSSLTTTGAGTLQFNFGGTLPSVSVSPMIISGAADFSGATPLVSVVVDAGLPLGTYPLASWGSLTGTAPAGAQLAVSTLAPGTGADLNLNGNTLELVISDTSVDVAKGDNIDDLNLGSSWSGGTAPGAADTAVWDNTVLGANATALGADLTWGTISILDPGGLVTINAGNTLTLGGDPTGLLPLIDMSSATQDLTINADLVMEDFGFWDVAAGRTLTVAGMISGTFGPIKAGDGTAIISGANTYTGETSVDAGTLQLGADDVIPNGAGSGNVFVLGTLDLNGFSDTINSLSGTGIVDNTAGSTTSTLTIGDDDQPSTFGGILQNTGGTLALTKIGSGKLTLEGANTLTGPIDVQEGALAFTSTTPFDNASNLTLAGGTTLQAEVGGASVGTPITLGSTGTTSTVDLPLSGGVTFNLNSVIGGDGNLVIDRSVGDVTAGTIILGDQSTYAGTTEFDTAGGLDSGSQLTVRLGVANALPATTVLTLDGGPGSGSGRSLEFDLNGFDLTLAGLTNVTGLSGRRQEITTSGGPSTLTIDNTANHSFGGSTSGTFQDNPWTAHSRLLGDISLVKSGTGIFTLVESHAYTGDTTINAGILSLEAPVATNDSSTMTIADSGAFLNLNFSGTDTVDKLFIGTTQLAPGEYKAPGSAATGTELAQLSGTGTLTVISGPVTDPFADWAATGTLPGTVTFEGDLNGDGIQDGLAFLLGVANPDDDANGALPTVSEDGAGGLVMSFNCLPSGDRGTAELRIGHSSDLGVGDPWQATTAQVPDATNAVPDNGVTYVVTPGSPTNAVVATIASSEAAAGKLFGRLQASE
ncbi:beta strand repeat-containing protein [Haloferula sp. A504]|uniref:beta strand repeat-containing protein n=1 Tax=Haloferula sp. A504 TaxID=3373601 RepID=UPI0031C677EC|nr:autotransporter-associated beta strand repeat-containing protein [Verrucomicrobiaceae bacterium E54]